MQNEPSLFDLPEHIEDIKESPTNPDAVLTDEQLRDGGLVKVGAFMRSKASGNALRIKKHREKTMGLGNKQLNCLASIEARETIKELAKRTSFGEDVKQVMAELAGTPAPTETQPAPVKTPDPKIERLTTEETELIQIGRQIKNLNSWKALLAKLILRSE